VKHGEETGEASVATTETGDGSHGCVVCYHAGFLTNVANVSYPSCRQHESVLYLYTFSNSKGLRTYGYDPFLGKLVEVELRQQPVWTAKNFQLTRNGSARYTVT
jgi:hypothetical protein